MPSTYSGLKFELIATGEQLLTWGDTTNTNVGTAIEQAIAGYGTANFATDADTTLGYSNSNTPQTFRNMVLNVTSSVSLTVTRNLVVPTTPKMYFIFNNTTGSQSIVVKTSAGSGITVPNGAKMMVYCDGTNVVESVTRFGSLSIGALSGILKGNGTSVMSVATANTDYMTPLGVTGQIVNSGTTSGTSTAYTLTPAIAIASYTADMTFWVTFHTASGNNPTLQISGLASPPNLVRYDNTGALVNIILNEIPSNFRSRVTLVSASQALVEGLPPSSGTVANGVLYENRTVISANYTLTTNRNAMTVGPITINTGVTLTVPTGARLVIL